MGFWPCRLARQPLLSLPHCLFSPGLPSTWPFSYHFPAQNLHNFPAFHQPHQLWTLLDPLSRLFLFSTVNQRPHSTCSLPVPGLVLARSPQIRHGCHSSPSEILSDIPAPASTRPPSGLAWMTGQAPHRFLCPQKLAVFAQSSTASQRGIFLKHTPDHYHWPA